MNSRQHNLARSHRRGVTLVEVLATLVLVGIVLPITMQGFALSMQTASRARHSTEAAQLAEAKLNELLVGRDPTLCNGTGEFGPDWLEYRWESRGFASDFGTYEVSVTVFWTERAQERSVTLTTLMYPSTVDTQ